MLLTEFVTKVADIPIGALAVVVLFIINIIGGAK